MMQFDTLFSRKWSKNAKFQAISENAETPSRQEMKQFDKSFLVENVYLKKTKSELFPPKTSFF